MKPATIKFCVKALATAGACFGLSGLLFDLAFLFQVIRAGDSFGIFFTVFGAVICACFIRVGYLAWFQWSPLAVRHAIGALAFVLFVAACNRARGIRAANSTGLSPAICFAGLLLIFVLYRWSVSYCCARLFPAGFISNTRPANHAPPAWKFVLGFLAFAVILGLIVYSWTFQIAHHASR